MKKIMVCMFFTTPIYSYVYNGIVMPKKGDQHKQIVILNSDYHDKTHPSNLMQRRFIENYIAHLDKNNSKVIVEDLSSANEFGQKLCASFFMSSNTGILAGLCTYCHRVGVPVENVEFRYCRVTSLGPIINNITSDPYTFSSVKGLKVRALLDETNTALKRVERSINNPLLKRVYYNDERGIQSQMSRLKLMSSHEQSMAEYINNYSAAQRLPLVKHLLTFDSAIIDIKIVNSIISSQANIIVVFAGGSHITRVASLLEKMGYYKAHVIPATYAKEYNGNKCIGSTMDRGNYCLKPKAISLDYMRNNLP